MQHQQKLDAAKSENYLTAKRLKNEIAELMLLDNEGGHPEEACGEQR